MIDESTLRRIEEKLGKKIGADLLSFLRDSVWKYWLTAQSEISYDINLEAEDLGELKSLVKADMPDALPLEVHYSRIPTWERETHSLATKIFNRFASEFKSLHDFTMASEADAICNQKNIFILGLPTLGVEIVSIKGWMYRENDTEFNTTVDVAKKMKQKHSSICSHLADVIADRLASKNIFITELAFYIDDEDCFQWDPPMFFPALYFTVTTIRKYEEHR